VTAIASNDRAAERQARRAWTRAQLANADLRRLLARELHDRVAQTLTTMLIDVENFKAEQVGRQSVLRQMDVLQQTTREVLSNLREVLYDLRAEPDAVGETFEEAVRGLLERHKQRWSMHVDLTVVPGWPSRVKAPAALNLYRIIEESLTNARQHSGATAVGVTLRQSSEDDFTVCVCDNGRGIDEAPSTPLGMGMVGMRERALFMGAELTVGSSPGEGTILTVVIPRATLV
jgi:signal transduction histidine kinase